ncbi:MAG: hypothetical protein AAF184_11575 [Pseudomonadota bacterium]
MNTVRQLDDSNSDYYVAKARPKEAQLRWEPRRYELSWGVQEFDGPHMVITSESPEYGVDLQVFFTTHKPLPDTPHHYIKVTPVRAMQVREPTHITTEIDGRLEMEAEVPAGAWIVQNKDGELYYNSAEEFAKRYEAMTPGADKP